MPVKDTQKNPVKLLVDPKTKKFVDAMLNDPINPNHYKNLNEAGYSALQVLEHWELGFHLGQVLKYIQRAGKKPGEDTVTDLKKAHWYLARYIHNLDPSFPDPMEQK